MSARPCPAPEDLEPILPGYDFADGFAIDVPGGRFDARSGARHVFGTSPAWIRALLVVRNALVSPFGLTGTAPEQPDGRIGWFPLISESAERVVLGLDDKHLDFRIVVDHLPGERRDILRASTVIRRHNLAGRAYLAAVMPFHNVIVPTMLNRLSSI